MMKTLTTKLLPALLVLLVGASGSFAQDALYQWINAAPYVTSDAGKVVAGQDSVYFCEDGIPIGDFFPGVGAFGFREASPFFGPGPAGTKTIAASTTADCSGVVASTEVTVEAGRNYQFILVGNADEVENPDGVSSALDFVVNDHAVVSGTVGVVDVTIVHASPDAPDVTGIVPSTGTILPLGPFKSFQPAQCEEGQMACSLLFPSILGVAEVEIHATAALEAGDTTAVTSVEVDLPALDGMSVTVVATGFLDPGAVGKVADHHGFKIIAVLTDGTVVELNPPAVDVSLEFAVDLSVEIATGNFDASVDIVTVAGSMNGWSTSADTLLPDFVNPNIYTKTIDLDDQVPPQTYFYKYVTGVNLEPGQSPEGWESGDNRELTMTGMEEVDPESGRLIVQQAEIPTWDNKSIEDFFANEMTITFEVDMRPAFYHNVDSGGMPIDVQTSEATTFDDGVWANGPLSKAEVGGDGWADWGPLGLGSIDEVRLHDDGATGGDLVADDSIFSVTFDYVPGQQRFGDIKFGTDGWDNESTFEGNHKLRLPDEAGKTLAEARVQLIFGAMEDGLGGYGDALYDAYICTYVDSPQVVRRGGDEGCDESATAVEAVDGEIPSQISLGDNYPNPFNPSTTFEYAITSPTHVQVMVYDLSGRLVDTLVDEVQSASQYRVSFDAANLASGVYIYQLRTADTVINKKMLLLK
jgi:hypothetical protein